MRRYDRCCACLWSSPAQTAGVIYLDSTRFHERFTEHHLKLMTAVAGIAALALENARRWESLRNENRRLRTEAAIEHDMVGESPAMAAVFQKIARLRSLRRQHLDLW